MDRTTCLSKANDLICNDRAKEYGDAQESFARIAAFWSAYIGKNITSKDVAMMMTLMKISRAKLSIKSDNYIDICGYAALSCEIDTQNH